MRTAIYARVSTADQEVDTQLQELRTYIDRRDDLELIGEYVDVGSGASEALGQFQALMAAAQHRKLDAVVFWDLSRLTRKGILHALTVLDQWQKRGVKAICYSFPNLDLTDPHLGQLMASMLAWFGQQEREMLRKRVKAGMATAKERGTRSGNPIGRPKLIASKVSDMRRLHDQGESYRQIAKKLGVSPGTVVNYTKNGQQL
jgi:putative DNA-invertase from lambdoid prophage Rac